VKVIAQKKSVIHKQTPLEIPTAQPDETVDDSHHAANQHNSPQLCTIETPQSDAAQSAPTHQPLIIIRSHSTALSSTAHLTTRSHGSWGGEEREEQPLHKKQ